MSSINDMNKKIPRELKYGNICIGATSIHGIEEKVYLNSNLDYGLAILGKQGSGKGVYLKNYISDCIKSGGNIILIDYLRYGDLTNYVKSIISEEDLIILDFEDESSIQSLSFNKEFRFDDEIDSPLGKMRKISMKTQNIIELLEGIDTNTLSYSSKRYLHSALNVVYSINEDASIDDAINILTSEDIRGEYIDKIPVELKEMLTDEIDTLLSLNKDNKYNKYNKYNTHKILDLKYVLNQCKTTSCMIKKDSSDDLDFEKVLEDGKSIIIRVNEDTFLNKDIVGMVSSLFIKKIFMSGMNRFKKMKEAPETNTHLILDDVYRYKNVLNTLKENLYYVRLAMINPVVTSNSILSLKCIKEEMDALNFNYMLLSGLDRNDFRLLQSQMSYPYTFEEFNELGKFSSLNLISDNNRDLVTFVTKLPEPVEYDKAEIDNEYV